MLYEGFLARYPDMVACLHLCLDGLLHITGHKIIAEKNRTQSSIFLDLKYSKINQSINQ